MLNYFTKNPKTQKSLGGMLSTSSSKKNVTDFFKSGNKKSLGSVFGKQKGPSYFAKGGGSSAKPTYSKYKFHGGAKDTRIKGGALAFKNKVSKTKFKRFLKGKMAMTTLKGEKIDVDELYNQAASLVGKAGASGITGQTIKKRFKDRKFSGKDSELLANATTFLYYEPPETGPSQEQIQRNIKAGLAAAEMVETKPTLTKDSSKKKLQTTTKDDQGSGFAQSSSGSASIQTGDSEKDADKKGTKEEVKKKSGPSVVPIMSGGGGAGGVLGKNSAENESEQLASILPFSPLSERPRPKSREEIIREMVISNKKMEIENSGQDNVVGLDEYRDNDTEDYNDEYLATGTDG